MLFNGDKKIIELNDNEQTIKINDMYLQWKQWRNKGDNLLFPVAFEYVGGNKLPDKYLGLTYFLKNGWRIKPAEKNHTLVVIGNIYTDNGESPFIHTNGDYNVLIENKISNIVELVKNEVVIANTKTTSSSNIYTSSNNDEDEWELN